MNLAFGFWVPIAFALLLNEVTHLRYKKLVPDSQLYALFHLHGSGRGHGGLLY